MKDHKEKYSDKPVVEILLATKNGEKYLVEQIDSLVEQSYSPMRVLIHDDGSCDQTNAILKSYRNKHPSFFHIIEDGIVGLGSVKNFEHLLSYSSADYIMFCDQDDVWLPEKVELMVKAIQEVEMDIWPSPVMVHCDLEVVDENLQVLHSSFFSYQGLPIRTKLPRQMVQNNVTGCATLLNRQALEISLPIPDAAIMHDWWIACCVLKHGGVVKLVPKSLVKYRQHSSNSIGAKGYTLGNQLKKLLDVKVWVDSYTAVLAQAKALGYKGKLKIFNLTLLKALYLLKRH